MESKSLLNARTTIAEIRSHFDFVFQRGFKMTSVLFLDQENEKWQVMLTTGEYLIRLQGYRESVSMAFSSAELYPDFGCIELHDLIWLSEQEGNASHMSEAPPSATSDTFAGIAPWLEVHIDDVCTLLEKIRLMVSKNNVRATDLEQLSGRFVV